MMIDKELFLLSLPFVCLLAAIWVSYMCNKPNGSWLFPKDKKPTTYGYDHNRITVVATRIMDSKEDAPDTKELVGNTLLYLTGLLSEDKFTKLIKESFIAEEKRKSLESQVTAVVKDESVGKFEPYRSLAYIGDKIDKFDKIRKY